MSSASMPVEATAPPTAQDGYPGSTTPLAHAAACCEGPAHRPVHRRAPRQQQGDPARAAVEDATGHGKVRVARPPRVCGRSRRATSSRLGARSVSSPRAIWPGADRKQRNPRAPSSTARSSPGSHQHVRPPGARYGLWPGRSVSAQRLNGASPAPPAPRHLTDAPWADGAITERTTAAVDYQRATLILGFDPCGPRRRPRRVGCWC